MAKTHVVKQGEHGSQIALDNGFPNAKTVLDDGSNAGLKAKRDLHVLSPGDVLTIPDFQKKQVDRETDATHPFVVDTTPLFLRLRLLDIDGNAVAAAPCEFDLSVNEVPQTLPTDAKGIVAQQIPTSTKNVEVNAQIPPKPPSTNLKALKFDLIVGGLNPEFKMSGQQARLNNLGYFAGYSLRDLDQFLWAVEEFECDFATKPVAKRPDLIAPPADGEDDETKVDPEQKTGIKDSGLFNKLETTHGI